MKKEAYAALRGIEDRHFWFVGLHELVISFFEDFKNQTGPMRIFDAGCGTGGLLARLGGYGETGGMDFSEEAVRLCRERGLTRVERMDLNDWSPPPQTFDVIICLDVLYHRSIVNVGDVLDRFHRALKPSGLLILNLPALEVLRRGHDEEVETGRRFCKKELASLLNDAKFKADVLTYRLPLLFPVLLIRRLLGESFFPADKRHDLQMPPALLNRLFLGMHRFENRWIRSGRGLPFGSSLFAVVRKK